MPQSKPPIHPDRLGLTFMHLHTMREGGDCDNIDDETLFPRRINNLVGDAQTIGSISFGGDYDLVFMTALTELAIATMNGAAPDEAVNQIASRFEEIAEKSSTLYLS